MNPVAEIDELADDLPDKSEKFGLLFRTDIPIIEMMLEALCIDAQSEWLPA